jgi:hypothetical protein
MHVPLFEIAINNCIKYLYCLTTKVGFILYLGFVGESILDCQPCDAMTSVHPECFPIPVPDDDPYFPKVNITSGKRMCIPVTRSMPGQLTLGKSQEL